MSNEGFSIRRELDALPADARAACRARLDELSACLHHISPYTLRDDSRLAFRSAMGLLPSWSPQAVAHEMACVQYLCDTMPYQDVQQPFLRGLANHLKESTGADWKAVWAAVAEQGSEILKLQMMHDHRLILPDFQPAVAPGSEESP